MPPNPAQRPAVAAPNAPAAAVAQATPKAAAAATAAAPTAAAAAETPTAAPRRQPALEESGERRRPTLRLSAERQVARAPAQRDEGFWGCQVGPGASGGWPLAGLTAAAVLLLERRRRSADRGPEDPSSPV
jgi:MYXO-CTERM domain-containing protein